MKSQSERIDKVLTTLPAIKRALTDDLAVTYDPVAQRRLIVQQAKTLRALANELDQYGYLTE